MEMMWTNDYAGQQARWLT